MKPSTTPLIMVGLAAILVAFLSLIVWSVLNSGKGSIKIITIPDGAQIIFNDKTYHSPAEIGDLKAGKQRIKITKEGYKDRKDTIIVRKNETSEGTFRLYTKEVLPTVLRSDLVVSKKQSELEKLLPSLPYDTIEFRIEYQVVRNKPSAVISLFAILNKPSQYQKYQEQLKLYATRALSWIRSKGVDPDKLNIIWKPKNPFE